jgi:hypothetical protein
MLSLDLHGDRTSLYIAKPRPFQVVHHGQLSASKFEWIFWVWSQGTRPFSDVYPLLLFDLIYLITNP